MNIVAVEIWLGVAFIGLWLCLLNNTLRDILDELRKGRKL